MTHEWAIETIITLLKRYSSNLVALIAAVGHRITCGSARDVSSSFKPYVVDEEMPNDIQDASHLAPL